MYNQEIKGYILNINNKRDVFWIYLENNTFVYVNCHSTLNRLVLNQNIIICHSKLILIDNFFNLIYG